MSLPPAPAPSDTEPQPSPIESKISASIASKGANSYYYAWKGGGGGTSPATSKQQEQDWRPHPVPQAAATAATATAAATTAAASFKPINKYCWDDAGSFVKLYVEASGVHELSPEAVACEFGRRSVLLRLSGLEGGEQRLHIANLEAEIEPQQCQTSVRKNMVIVRLRKVHEQKWFYLRSKKAMP